MNKTDVIVYTASSMTGRTGEELIAQSKHVHRILGNWGITVLDPIAAENVKDSDKPLHNTGTQLAEYWQRDKRMIREAHVLLDITGPAKSEGVAHEIGYARYNLWKPVVRIYAENKSKISVARFEDDIIVESLPQAAEAIVKHWGTRNKRIVWRIKMLMRCLPRWIKYQMGEWK